MNEQVQIDCGLADRDGKRLVIASLGQKSHRDRFDCDNSFARSRFIERVIAKLKLPESAHEYLNDEIVRFADEADEAPAALWEPEITILADVESEQPEWLWDGRFPLGAISLVDGDAGLGKSQLMIDLACRGSRGDAMPPLSAPDGTFESWSTLFITSEDSASFSMRPRVDAAGGDPRRIITMSAVSLPGIQKRQIELPTDIPVLEKVITDHGVRLVTFDPYTEFLASTLNVNSDPDNRKALGPLNEMAQRLKVAVVCIRHLNKKTNLSARHRGGGSVAILAAARSALLLGVDPDDGDFRVLAPTKNNLAPEPPSLRFRIEQVGTTSRVRWEGECDISANQMCKAEAAGNTQGSKLDVAKEIISGILANGSRGSNEVEGACTEAGVSFATYRRAKKELGILAEKTEFQGNWLLSLPGLNGHAGGF